MWLKTQQRRLPQRGIVADLHKKTLFAHPGQVTPGYSCARQVKVRTSPHGSQLRRPLAPALAAPRASAQRGRQIREYERCAASSPLSHWLSAIAVLAIDRIPSPNNEDLRWFP